MPEIVLISISGKDHPGLTSAFAHVLAESDAVLLDIGQAVIHDVLALGIMVQLPAAAASSVRQAIDRRARELGVIAHLAPVSPDQYQKWIQKQHKQRFTITLLAEQVQAADLAAIAKVFAARGVNIDTMDRLSSRSAALDLEPRMCIEFNVSGNGIDASDLRRSLLVLADHAGFDVAVQQDSIFRRNRRLVAFDMDSTLIQMEVIDELARLANAGEKVAAITAAAMRGELDFESSLRRRLALLKGLPERAIVDLGSRLPITPGAHRLLRTLKLLGYKTAIISGGFRCFATRLQQELGFDFVCANELALHDGMITGEAVGDIVTARRKADALQEIAAAEGLSMEQTIAIGDGANDLPMLSVAGLGIAFHAKPVVRERAQHSISRMGLDALLYLLGLRDRYTEVGDSC
ncbi:MAG TPA: phosphoserine phosphatase SerB [Candidatus Sulfotelmatobacter sp.]|nr:phosphoserine phosphatase SerB [Candidatus Sulfotelmatobacter sp.]